MANIIFFFSHCSHQNSSMAYAKKLQLEGYEVAYAGPEFGISGDNLQANVEKQGIKYLQLNFYDLHSSEKRKSSLLSVQERSKNYIRNLLDGSLFEDFIRKQQADLLVLDVHLPFLAIVFYKFGIPIIFASAGMLYDQSNSVPPMNSPIIPTKEKIGRGEIEQIWKKHLQDRKFSPGLKKLLSKLSIRHDFPLEEKYYEGKSIVPFGLKFPEIIFWPQELDFHRPTAELEQKYYLGGIVDIDRKETDVEDLPQNNNPIIYCMLGTRSSAKGDKKNQFLKKLIRSLYPLTQYTFLVSLGKFLEAKDFESLPDHIILRPFFPQISVLKLASAMITHSGGDSTKECIRMGVPMICFPHDNDQFGNAARISHYQLGIMREMKEESLDELDELLLELIDNKKYRANVLAFQKLFIQDEKSLKGINTITSFLYKEKVMSKS